MIRPTTVLPLTVAIILTAVLSGCGGGYKGDNVELAEMVVGLDELIDVRSVEHNGYCKADSCWLGNDSTSTTYHVEFLADADTVVELVETKLPRQWRLDEIFCDGPLDDCGGEALFHLTSVDSAVTMIFVERSGGPGQVLVDAHIG